MGWLAAGDRLFEFDRRRAGGRHLSATVYPYLARRAADGFTRVFLSRFDRNLRTRPHWPDRTRIASVVLTAVRWRICHQSAVCFIPQLILLEFPCPGGRQARRFWTGHAQSTSYEWRRQLRWTKAKRLPSLFSYKATGEQATTRLSRLSGAPTT